MATRIKPGKSVFTADDRAAGTIEKVTKTYAYTKSGERFALSDLDTTWTV